MTNKILWEIDVHDDRDNTVRVKCANYNQLSDEILCYLPSVVHANFNRRLWVSNENIKHLQSAQKFYAES